MRRLLWVGVMFMILVIFYLINPLGRKAEQGDDFLWPEIEPFRTGFLKVSGIHEIYYELCGNPEGDPVFVLHGGPGGMCSPYMRRFFNPECFLIVLHDQRGAGRSRPYGELRENTTPHLVSDIERLRKFLDLETILLFGGSWGSTLGLAYAETYPENVRGMVLRGVFTATQEEIDHFYHGGAGSFFPEAYDRLIALLPDPGIRPLPDALLQIIQGDDQAQSQRISMAWTKYEFKLSGLEIADETVNDEVDRYGPRAAHVFGLFENHYMANRCFLEEGQLFRDADKILKIPTILVNGRYDMICPPVTAYRLHQLLPNSRLVIAEQAGHWMGEPPIEEALIAAMKSFE